MIEIRESKSQRLITLSIPDCDDLDQIKEQLEAEDLELAPCQQCKPVGGA